MRHSYENAICHNDTDFSSDAENLHIATTHSQQLFAEDRPWMPNLNLQELYRQNLMNLEAR
jgi:hypothetical protein